MLKTVSPITAVPEISVDAGSVSDPSISKNGDPNTGFFFPANDTIAESVGGIQARTTTPGGNQILNGSFLPLFFTDTSALKGVAGLNAGYGKTLCGQVANVANAANADFVVGYFAMGFLVISNEFPANANIRTVTTYSVISRGGNLLATQIGTQDGPTGAAAFTLAWSGNETLRVTNNYANATTVTMAYFGF